MPSHMRLVLRVDTLASRFWTTAGTYTKVCGPRRALDTREILIDNSQS